MTTILVTDADHHSNSVVGLMPPHVLRDAGNKVLATKAQLVQWRAWLKFWAFVQGMKEELKCDVWRVIAGDVADINSHNKMPLISGNPTTAVDIAIDAQEPAMRVVDKLWVVRGTEAHAGPQCHLEERFAKDYGAVPDPETGRDAWEWLPLVVEGVKFDIGHHPQTAGYRPWTARAAASRQSAITLHEYAEQRQIPPDVVIRAHVHYFADSGLESYPRTFFLPPWQLCTSFGRRLGVGVKVEPIGGVIFICENGEFRPIVKRYQPRRGRVWKSST